MSRFTTNSNTVAHDVRAVRQGSIPLESLAAAYEGRLHRMRLNVRGLPGSYARVIFKTLKQSGSGRSAGPLDWDLSYITNKIRDLRAWRAVRKWRCESATLSD